MTLTPTTSYTTLAKVFHWVTAILVVTAIAMSITMVRIQGGPVQDQLYDLHRSFGVLILVLTAARLLWRGSHPAPPLVSGLPAWQEVAARTTHFLLYLILVTMPLLGWAATSAYGAPIRVFGLFEWPAVLAKDEHLANLLFAVHRWLGLTLLALLVLHAGAAFHHHFVRGDETLRRMLPRLGRD